LGSSHRLQRKQEPSCRHDTAHFDDNTPLDLDALMEENAMLRGLVVQLSKLAIKNAVDRK
jgi:hypothetical protein